jgi:enoyl-CoA hydratase
MSDPADRPRVQVEVPARDPVSGKAVSGVALLRIDRPEALNAIDLRTMHELVQALESLDQDASIRCAVVTGAGERAFAAGADVAEMVGFTREQFERDDPFRAWDRLRSVSLPLIAAVRGYALGGGCELVLACDLVIAGDDAVFGQPEIRLGIIPGIGATQRLARTVGKARAMELVLTGRRFDAAEAQAMGLVSRVVPAAETLTAALALAADVAAAPPLAVRAAVQAVDAAFESTLEEGLARERAGFAALFGTADQQEGMRAFLEKRPPRWRGE